MARLIGYKESVVYATFYKEITIYLNNLGMTKASSINKIGRIH